jgi:hypothetical protein
MKAVPQKGKKRGWNRGVYRQDYAHSTTYNMFNVVLLCTLI